MRRGDFEAAWRETDRIELPRRALQQSGRWSRQAHHLLWDGTPFDGRDVVIRCDHGLGDTLQFVRYVPRLLERARSVTLLVQPPLVELFAGDERFREVRGAWIDEPLPRHDVEIEVMELPYAFRSTIDTLPRDVPYLPRAPIEAAARTLPTFEISKFNVGLLWASSDWDASRSLPPAALAPLCALEGVSFHSLQQGNARHDCARTPVSIQPLHRHTERVSAAAAAMTKLDLVITVDCMAAHLAGALARPVWVLLRREADWRWMHERRDSPWYPTMRLYRQPRDGSWATVLETVAAELSRLVRSAERASRPGGTSCRSRV